MLMSVSLFSLKAAPAISADPHPARVESAFSTPTSVTAGTRIAADRIVTVQVFHSGG